MAYPTTLEIVTENLDEKLPTKFCLDIKYLDYSKQLVNDILNEYHNGKIIDLKDFALRIRNKGKVIYPEYYEFYITLLKTQSVNILGDLPMD